MKPVKKISTPQPMIADKKVIHEHLTQGGGISELEAKGFNFVKFL